MANVPYNPIPDVQPSNLPDAYQRADTSGFEGITALGQAATKAADFYDQAAVDDGYNQLQQKGTSLLYGTGNTGPGGTGGQPGYLSLNGKAALDGRPQVQQQLDGYIDTLSQGFSSDEQRQAFKTRAASYRTGFFTDVGSHSDAQSNTWYGEVNNATANNQLDLIATNTDFDPGRFSNATHSLIDARMKAAQLAGAQPGDPVWTAAFNGARQEAVKTQALAIATKDPSKALDFVETNKGMLGTDYDNVYSDLRARSIAVDGGALATQAMGNHAASGGSLVRVPQTGIPNWSDQYYTNISASESGNNPNARSKTSTALGPFQILDGTARAIEQAHPELGLTGDWRRDPVQARKGYAAFTADNAQFLSSRGVPITPGNLYLAAFFGGPGAAHFHDLPDSTPMNQAVDQRVWSANSGLFVNADKSIKTVGDIRAWAARAAGKGIDPAAGGIGGAAPAGQQPPAQDAAAPAAPIDVGHPDNVLQFPVNVPPGAPAVPPAADVEQAATIGTTPAGSASAKAQIIQSILDSDDSALVAKYGVEGAQQVKANAISTVNQQLSALQVAADQTAAQKKAANDQAMNGYVTKMLTPGTDLTGMQQHMATDPNLTGEAKLSLNSALVAHADNSVSGATAAYGDGYYDTMKRILASPGDPNRIGDASSILQMAVPGPNGETPQLTLAGASKLQTMMTEVQKNPDQAAVNDTKASLLKYARSKLSFQQDAPDVPGMKPLTDYQGEQIFNARFVPKFEAAYDKWVGSGKDPFDFLTQDNVDKLSQGLRSPGEMAMAKLQAMQTGVDLSDIQVPPPPVGVDPDGWKLVMISPPTLPDGKPSAPDKWMKAITLLQQQPTPEMMGKFDSFFGQSGVAAKDVLDVLGIQPRPQTEAEKKAATQAAQASTTAPVAPVAAGPVYTARNPKPAEATEGTNSPVFPVKPVAPAIPTGAIPGQKSSKEQYPAGITTETMPKKPKVSEPPASGGFGGGGL